MQLHVACSAGLILHVGLASLFFSLLTDAQLDHALFFLLALLLQKQALLLLFALFNEVLASQCTLVCLPRGCNGMLNCLCQGTVYVGLTYIALLSSLLKAKTTPPNLVCGCSAQCQLAKHWTGKVTTARKPLPCTKA